MITLSYALRAKERKHYTDEDIDDDEIEGKRNYDVQDKLNSDKYDGNFVEQLTGSEFSMAYIQKGGMEDPILIKDKTGLGMRIPSDNFQVSDVKQCVGSRRMLDVMDVNTQRGMEMSMKEWVRYYENKDRDRLLNVISLEFSHTRLETYVDSPTVVRQVDWVDAVWPRHLKEIHTEATNIIEKMKYPKVQKYCLMSVAGCYTDFHVDFGGTSVWYHILHGEKVFWLVPPTPENLEMYETWVLSGKQGDVFLADTVPSCQKIVLKKGYTFMIPSGWIHAVYTPMDSLVFGGNFIHSYNILQQLKVSEMEDRTRVPQKFRYPFYTEMMWYVLAQYIRCLKGKSFLSKQSKDSQNKAEKNGEIKTENGDESPGSSKTSKNIKSESVNTGNADSKLSNGIEASPRRSSRRSGTASTPVKSEANGEETEDQEVSPKPKTDKNSEIADNIEDVKAEGGKGWVHLTPYELKGLVKLVEYLENLPPSKQAVPKDLLEPDTLLVEMKALLKEHENDDPSKAVTGEEVIKWPPSPKMTKPKPKHGGPPKANKSGKNAAGNRRRRTRCKKCPACVREDCAECHFCKDMKKFGGPGRMKQSCISRQCMAPVLPNTATCIICGTDERNSGDVSQDQTTSLMECMKCWEIVHPTCLNWKYLNIQNEGVVNEDLPNSWECPKCCQGGAQGGVKAREEKDGLKNPEGKVEMGESEMSEEEEQVSTKKLKKVEGKRVTSKVSSFSKLKTISLAGKRNKVKKSAILPARLKIQPALHTKVKASLSTVKKLMGKGELPAGMISPPVITRSGRTVVQKRTPEDEEMEMSPVKRQKREETSPKAGRGKKGQTVVVAASSRGQATSVHSDGTNTPGSAKARGKGRGRPAKVIQDDSSTSADQSMIDSSVNSTESQIPGHACRGSTPVSGDKSGVGDCNKARTKIGTDSELKGSEQKPVPVPPKYVIRPAPIPPPSSTLELDNGQKHVLAQNHWQKIFQYVHHADLARCMVVCKTWNRWCIDKMLWYELDLSHKKLKQVHLVGVVRRQPTVLNLNYAVISPKQLSWLIERLPHVKKLSLAYCSWGTLSALCSSSCPLLTYIDLSWASGLRDVCFKDLISPAADHRPSVRIVSRLHRLTELQMAGTDISDSSLAIMPRHLTNLEKLDLSYCIKLTNKGIEYLTNEGTSTRYNLKELDLTGCNQLTDDCLTFLANCPKLVRIKLKACHKISVEDCQAFTMTYPHRKLTLCSDFDKLIVCPETDLST